MEKYFFHRVFQLIILFLAALCLEITAADQSSNIINSSTTFFYLKDWQIVNDAYSKDSLPIIPDSLWQLFEPTLDDDRYNGGSWLIRTNIDITDSLNHREVFGLFPMNFVTAYEIYWDGIKIGQTGVIGDNTASEKAGDFNYNFALPPNLLTYGNHTIIIRLSNYDNYSSWKWFYGDIVIGKYDLLQKKYFDCIIKLFL